MLILIKLENMFKFLFGIQKVKYTNGKLKPMGKTYKIYASAMGMFNLIAILYQNIANVGVYMKGSELLKSLLWTTRTSYSLLYIVVIYGNSFFFPEKTIDIFHKFKEIDKKFERVKKCNDINKRVILNHFIFFVLLSSGIICECLYSPYYLRLPIAINIMSANNIEIFHFALEMNQIVARVKTYNEIITNYTVMLENKLIGKRKLNIALMHLSFHDLIYIYNKIHSVIIGIDYCYRILLFVKVITMYNHCLCISSTYKLYESDLLFDVSYFLHHHHICVHYRTKVSLILIHFLLSHIFLISLTLAVSLVDV